jgi:hypothetical protein
MSRPSERGMYDGLPPLAESDDIVSVSEATTID